MSNIHIYIREPENKTEYQLSIDEAQQLTNGTCDSIVFQELNYIDPEDINNMFNVLFDKLSYYGSCFIQWSHMESILNDYNFHKIDEKKLNELLFGGRRNLISESSMMNHVLDLGFLIKNLVYDEYLIKLEIVKNHGTK
jgi:hypothetical protein